MTLSIRAPAKINLYLRVFPRRGDGFHPLRSWFRTIELHDELSIHSAIAERRDRAVDASTQGVTLQVQCTNPAVPGDDSNLAVRAVHAVLRRGPVPLTLRIEKRIPVGAGLGGGSSDAAAALVLAWRISGQREPLSALTDAASRLGSDVPFFFRAQLDSVSDATCTGRGEIVHGFIPTRRHVVLLVLPDLHVSTPAVYRAFDELPAPAEDDSPDFAQWSALSARQLLEHLRNDLEAPAFALHPPLRELHRAVGQALGRPVRMSGSGSALLTLFDNREEAQRAAERLAALPVRPVIA